MPVAMGKCKSRGWNLPKYCIPAGKVCGSTKARINKKTCRTISI
jgi:hypothetical protein